MSSVREVKSEPIAQFGTPFAGTVKNQGIHKVPIDAIYDSLNVLTREGKLRNRYGLRLLDNTTFPTPVIGGSMCVSPFGNILLSVTQRVMYERVVGDVNWRSIAVFDNNDTFTVDVFNMVDMAFIDTSGVVMGVIASKNRPLKTYNSQTHVVSVMTPGVESDPIPLAKSICIASRRLITLVDPHTIQWSKVFDISNFPPLAKYRIAQTTDVGVCVRSLSSLSFVLYKERSIITARAQAGNDEVAFAFAEPIKVEGPASIHAVVDVGGVHIYMTKNGRIGLFDGTSYPQWLADGLWVYLQNDINPQFTSQIFGVFDYRLHCVIFYYPKKGYVNGLYGIVIVNMLPKPHAFLGLSAIPCSFGYEMRHFESIDRSLIFADLRSSVLDEEYNYDNDLPFPCMFQTGLIPLPDARHGFISIEHFFERGYGYGDIVINPVTSDGLEDKDGFIPDLKSQVDTLEFNPVRKYISFGIKTRFFGLKYTWQSSTKVRYAGTTVYAGQLI